MVMSAKALLVAAMCVFLSLALHGCGCDTTALVDCWKALKDTTCEPYSKCAKDGGCCDTEIESGGKVKDQTALICLFEPAKDACK